MALINPTIVVKPEKTVIEVTKRGFQGPKGDNGATFTPTISQGVLEWSNDKDLVNPDPFSFMAVITSAINEAFDRNVATISKEEINEIVGG